MIERSFILFCKCQALDNSHGSLHSIRDAGPSVLSLAASLFSINVLKKLYDTVLLDVKCLNSGAHSPVDMFKSAHLRLCHASEGCTVYHGCMLLLCCMTIRVARQNLGPSHHAPAGRRRPLTSGGVGVMTDGRAVMVGARSGSPRGKAGPLLSSRMAGRLGY